jgi:hypothetical protein
MPLIPAFRAAAQQRGLIAEGDGIDATRAFRLVRDMPYRRASSRAPETTIDEWTGTCSGKHYLLKALIEELGFATSLIACTHQFTAENSPWLPPELLAHLADGPMPDVHQFLRVESNRDAADGAWMTVDATWPLAARDLGLPTNEQWELGRDMTVAADIDELFHTPDDIDPQEFKNLIIEREIGDQMQRRDRFIEALSDWLGAAIPDSPSAQHNT